MPTKNSVDQRTRERLRAHLLAIMKEHNLNANRMAIRLDVHRSTLGAIINEGRTMGLDVFLRLHREFNISANYLLDSDPEEEGQKAGRRGPKPG